MNPSTMRPFPISVVAMGPGSQGEEAPDYLPMPKGMDTFHQPRLPDNASPEAIAQAARLLGLFLEGASQAGMAGGARLDLLGLEAGVRDVINQSMGFGEVSAFTTAPEHWRVQETAFAGIWRVLKVADDGAMIVDRLETGAIPEVLTDAMQRTAAGELPAPDYPAGCMNAQALVEEIRMQAAAYRAGQSAHIINLSLLPVSDADLDTLYGWLGHREVSLLSRGYGNCRITSTRLKNVWWVQYFNSMDALILNSIEVIGMPDVALAADEDFADSVERLNEYLDMMAEPA
ncbi:hydrogenase expression/formation protein [Dechloromonas sp. XY25]|uniref:Hydrogenase expression/formation protein n=1 Tax=Dechloromonas hankyongensis TaxID=2908002 RepID=A0ABS9JXN3_9RHOO|nr:hydrogenase expression/formation protein [Dechloromonas hankyongensis]MCG2575589.1 hydrogenase expression/formation protein [Dechloromonas hankyongensis]